MGFRIVGSAGPIGAAARSAQSKRSQRAIDLAEDWRREHRPESVFRDKTFSLLTHLWREVDQVIHRNAIAAVDWRLGGKRLRRRIPLARRVALLHRTLLNRPHRLSCHSVKYVEETLLG